MQAKLECMQALCAQLQARITTSNSIIPRTELPGYTVTDIPRLKQKYGHVRFAEYERYSHLLNHLRAQTSDLTDRLHLPCPRTAALLAITHFGMGECHEISTAIFFELLKQGYHDCAMVCIQSDPYQSTIHPRPFLHLFVLVGAGIASKLRNGCDFSAIDELAEDVIIMDGLLNHVGRANQYRSAQHTYLQQFNYNKIHALDLATQQHVQNLPIISQSVQILIDALAKQAIRPFKVIAQNPCHETALLSFLNAKSGLKFHGYTDASCKVDAVSEIHSAAEKDLALRIQARLHTGFFKEDADKTFFIIPEINVDDDIMHLPRTIQHFYR